MIHNEGKITFKKAKELLKLSEQEIKEWQSFRKDIKEIIIKRTDKEELWRIKKK